MIGQLGLDVVKLINKSQEDTTHLGYDLFDTQAEARSSSRTQSPDNW